jgi:virginiamycin B lyase
MEARYAGAGSPGLTEGAQAARSSRSRLGRRAALVLATLAIATLALAARADAFVYWTNYKTGAISRANLDGTGVNQSFITGLRTSPSASPFGVALDDAHAYWTYWDTDSIGRANLDGTGANRSFIAAPTSRGSQVAVDGAHVYWVSKFSDGSSGPPDLASPGTGAIGRANLDGTGVDPNFISGISFPAGGVAVDGSHLYWSSYAQSLLVLYQGPIPGAIGRANLNGTGVQENFIATHPTDYGVAVDEAHVWWAYSAPGGTGPTPTAANALVDGIGRANLDGTGAEFVIEPGGVLASAIAVNDTHVYSTGGPLIGRANLDGSSVIWCFITGTDARGGVAVDALGPPPGPPPSNEFRLSKAKLNKKRGSAKLTVKVPGPGKLKLAETGSVKGQHKRADQCEPKLPVKPRGKAKRRLNETGEAKVKAKVTYTPKGGASDTKSKTIKLVKR